MQLPVADGLFRQVLQQLSDGVYLVDREGRIVFWSDAAQRITGMSAHEVIGRHCSDNLLCHIDANGRNLCVEGCPLHASIGDGQPRNAEAYLHHRDGHRLPVSIRTAPFRDENGVIVGGVEVFSDASSRLGDIEQIRRLEKLAYIDPLTGVGNRRFAEVTLQNRAAESQRLGWPFGVVMADIDHFKKFNDTYGHETGDAVLRVVARTLAASLRGYDQVTRWGGEEFLLILGHVSTTSLAALAERCRALVAKAPLRTSNSYDGNLHVSISLGGAVSQPNETVDELLARADAMLYAAKAAGRDCALVADAELPARP